MLKCPNQDAKKIFMEKVDTELKETMENKKTCPTLQDTIIDALNSHRSGYIHCITALFATQELKDIIQAQQKIGWDNFVLGHWSPLWQTAQARYLLIIGNKRSLW